MLNHRILLISCILAPAFVQNSAFAEDQCFNLASHAEARACLDAHAKESALAVTNAENSLRSTLSNWDQEQQYKTRSISKLDTSATQFQRYRKAQCDLQASLAAGGNAAGDRRLLCHIALDEKRVAELQAAKESLK